MISIIIKTLICLLICIAIIIIAVPIFGMIGTVMIYIYDKLIFTPLLKTKNKDSKDKRK